MRQIRIQQVEARAAVFAVRSVGRLGDAVVRPTGVVVEPVVGHRALVRQRIVSGREIAMPAHRDGFAVFAVQAFLPAVVRHALLVGAAQLGDVQIRQCAVDAAVDGELLEHLVQAAQMRHRGHAVALFARVGEDAGIGDKDLRQRVVDLIAFRCGDLFDVIRAVAEVDAAVCDAALRRTLHGEHAGALHRVRVVRMRGDAGLQRRGAFQQGFAVRAHLVRRIQANRRAFHWIAGIVELLHDRRVAHVGDGDLHAEHTHDLAFVRAFVVHVDAIRVLRRDVGGGVRGGVVHAHRVQRVLPLGAAQHVVVGAHVAGELGDVCGQRALGVAAEEMQVIRAFRSVRFRQPRDRFHAVVHRRAGQGPAGPPASGDAVPCVGRQIAGARPVAVEHHGEHLARGGVVRVAVDVVHRGAVRHGQRLVAHRPCAGIPRVGVLVAQQHALAVRTQVVSQPNIRGFSVSRRSVGLLEHVMRDAAAVACEVGEVHRLAGLVVGEGVGAVLVGDAFADEVGGGVRVIALRLVQFEARALHRVALLVEFDEAVRRDVGEVVLELQVGIAVAAFHVEEVECVVAAVGERVRIARRPFDRLEFVGILAVGGLEHVADRGGLVHPAAGVVGDFDGAVLEVDVQRGRVVDAAHVADEHAVDEHPHVVVTGEVEGHRVAVEHAVGGLHEFGLRVHAEVMVQVRATRLHVAGQRSVRVLREHVLRGIEWEELADLVPIVDRTHRRRVVQRHRIRGFAGDVLVVQGGEVLGAVVDVVAVLQLQQSGDVRIGPLVARLIGVLRIEQVVQ